MKSLTLLGLAVLAACGGEIAPSPGETGPGTVASEGLAAPGGASQSVAGILCFGGAEATPTVNKSFVIGDRDGPWSLQERITSATPAIASLAGREWTGPVRFRATASELQVVWIVPSTPSDPGDGDQPVIDQWPISNVDVSSGCSTSAPPHWQTAGWVTWGFEKADLSDLKVFNGLGTLVPGSGFDAGPAFPACVAAATNVDTSLVAGSYAINAAAPSITWREAITADIACPGVDATQLVLDVQFTFTPP